MVLTRQILPDFSVDRAKEDLRCVGRRGRAPI
jgi:hypothetical protein